jgi:hypothetical protein
MEHVPGPLYQAVFDGVFCYLNRQQWIGSLKWWADWFVWQILQDRWTREMNEGQRSNQHPRLHLRNNQARLGKTY